MPNPPTRPRTRPLAAVDRLLGAALATLLVGAALAFGGATWWAPPALAALTTLLVAAALARAWLGGGCEVFKSPLMALGVLALALAALQLAPLPSRLAGRLSPRARAVYALGTLPDRALADDPSATWPEPASGRSPATLDRPATLRWLAGALAGLALFAVAGRFADRLQHALVIWGSIVAAFGVTTALALVQLAGGSPTLFGLVDPGRGPSWGPSTADLAALPSATAFRVVAASANLPTPWALAAPDRPYSLGTLLGGPGAYLALGALAIPLAFGLALQLLAPRGSRLGVRDRLRESGHAGLVVLLLAATLAGSALCGALGGWSWAVPLGAALLLAGWPSAWASGLRWGAIALTMVMVTALGGGVVVGARLGPPEPGGPLAARGEGATARAARGIALHVAREFPLVGAGLGAFPAVAPYFKATDATPTTAHSTLLRWAAESGVAGLGLLALGLLWVLLRLPGALRRVGTADRHLALGVVGAGGAFLVATALHWTAELPAIALAACAFAGTCDRWLAGGTDLFVEAD